MRVAPVDDSHVARLAPCLRRADLRELAAATGETPSDALGRLQRISSPCLSILGPDGAVWGMFGVVHGAFGAAEVWLLGADALVRSPRALLRGAAEWIPRLHESYRVLWCKVDARNGVHLRWLAWCGFVETHVIDDYGVEHRGFVCLARESTAPMGRRLGGRARGTSP
jgi:hypothetical protein